MNDDDGIAVLVNGKIVAWFAEDDGCAQEYATEHHFGNWLLHAAKQPQIIPFTVEQIEAAQLEAARLFKNLVELPMADNE